MRRLLAVGRLVARNRGLLRLVLSYGIFITTEYAVWIAMLVYAYDNGGPSEAGLVAVAQLAPAAVVAPALSTLADRYPPVRLLVCSYLVQGLAMGLVAGLIIADAPRLAVYAAAVIASVAIVGIRPGQAPLLPAVATSTAELTSANVALAWAESVGVVLAGLLIGLTLEIAGVEAVFAGCAVLVLVAAAMVWSIRSPVLGGEGGERAGALAGVRATARLLVKQPRPRVLAGICIGEYVVIGGLDVLFVVFADSVIMRGDSWAGYLNSAYGIGGMLAVAPAAFLIGRRLGGFIIVSGSIVSGSLALAAANDSALLIVLALGCVGAGRSVLDTATRTLLQRAVPAGSIGRVFGLVEGLSMAALAVGTAIVPLAMSLGGIVAAVLCVAAVLPLCGLLGGRAVLGLDAEAQTPVVEIALLRGLRIFANLPAMQLERLARSMSRVELDDGEVLMREGDPGHRYYAIAEGRVSVQRGGRDLGFRSRGDGVGEIALLRSVPRTATITAVGSVALYALDRDDFLEAVAHHSPTARVASAVADERLRDEDPTAWP
jgi:MFS family permease